jgi:hypothetical protein
MAILTRTLVASLFLFFTLNSVVFAAPVILFDEAHKQPFKISGDAPLDLSKLAAHYREQGFLVKENAALLSAETLNAVDVLVISGAFLELTEKELAAVVEFVENGGGLAVMLHIAPPMRNLLHKLEVDFTNGTLREVKQVIGENPLDFVVSSFVAHPVTNGLESFSIYGSWALRGTAPNVMTLAQTSKHGWVDLDRDNKPSPVDAMQEFAVMVAGELGKGRFVVIGDDAIFQNRYLDEANKKLAVQMMDWLSFSK